MASSGPGGPAQPGPPSPSPKPRRPSNNSQASQPSPQKKRAVSSGPASNGNAEASGSGGAIAPSALEENTIQRLKSPRSLPPWIDSYNPRYGAPPDDQLRLLSPSTVPPTMPIPATSHAPAAHPSSSADPSSSAAAEAPFTVRRVSRDGYVEELPALEASSSHCQPASSTRRDRGPSSSTGGDVPTAALAAGTSGAPKRNVSTSTGAAPKGGLIQRILGKARGAERGRKWDHLRSAEPVIVARLPVPKQAPPTTPTRTSRGTLGPAGVERFGAGSSGGGAAGFADLVAGIQESRRAVVGGGGAGTTGSSSGAAAVAAVAAAGRLMGPRAQTSGSGTSSANGRPETARERRSRGEPGSRGNTSHSRRGGTGYSTANGNASAPHTANGSPPQPPPSTADSPWRDFVQSSVYGRVLPGEESVIVDVTALNEMQPGFNKPLEWGPTAQHGGQHPRERALRRHRYGASSGGLSGAVNGNGNGYSYSTGLRSRGRRRARFYERIWTLILRHPLVPLIFRLVVLVTSVVALAIAARLFELERHRDRSSGDAATASSSSDSSLADLLGTSSAERTQAIVAIAVDTVAIPYIGYMTWDEYTGKPLGLRPPTQKISLTLMDLFFIIFKAASTTLAFESLVYHQAPGGDGETLQLSRALASFMFVGLLSWTMNFTVNVFRLVEKLGGAGDDPDGKL